MADNGCPLCYNSFASKRGLSGHMRTHTSTERRAAATLIAMRHSNESDSYAGPARLVWTTKGRRSARFLVPSGEQSVVRLESPEKSPVNDGKQMPVMAEPWVLEVVTREEMPKPVEVKLELPQPGVAEEAGGRRRQETEDGRLSGLYQPLADGLAAAPPPLRKRKESQQCPPGESTSAVPAG
ncbi:unnamed protein product [Spirodela intermedia]|uniref:C2H2-type domain-containing protein n=1 Tax=Spirodela intermedia TaxID=51605 RepID=A0A7I8J5V6_SPIIN|nr:unnamed protein product [Spirodela intermedia]CAA6664783.1 unnamed protein product [Spirodela intermedia]